MTGPLDMGGNALADKAGRSYWDRVWQGEPLPEAVNPRVQNRHNHVQSQLHDYFVRAFAHSGTRHGMELLEIGAARSSWLPYFAKEFGFRVTGLDYSEVGCEQAQAILRNEGVSGRIVLADFADPPEDMLGAFDVVVSFGVIEHFEETSSCLCALSRFLKPGGVIVSLLPNMVGVTGWLQKHLCRSIFDVHVPLDRRVLVDAHHQAGLTVLSCQYFLGGGFTSLSLACKKESLLFPVIRRLPSALSLPFWFLDRIGANVKPNRLTSPYLICLARK